MDCRPAAARVLQRVPGLVQDLERGDGRRKHLHVAAGRADDLVDRGAGGDLYYTLWPRGAAPREMPGIAFVTGNHANVLQPGELLRSVHLPVAAVVREFDEETGFRPAG